MAVLNPYLNFAGNTEEAFNFYRSVFGGEFIMLQRFSQTPDAEKIPEKDRNMIMHISLRIGKTGSSMNNILMGTDAPESMGFHLTQGNNFYLCLSPESEEEAKELFEKLSEGGNVSMPMQQMFWGALYGDFTDKFGIKWMVNYMKEFAGK